MTRINPYALLLGPIIGIMVFFVMRHPPFSLFIGVLATMGLDYFFKTRARGKIDTDKDGQ